MSIRTLRNLGVIAHINAGKTTLTERILFSTGKQRFVGEVDAGTAAMDWLPEEQARGISIGASCTTVEWRGLTYQLIDTPGHVDFTSEVERSLRILDGVILVIDAGAGIEPQTEAVWKRAAAFDLPALVFVNKIDRSAPSWQELLDEIGDLTGRSLVPIVEPIVRETDGGTAAIAVADRMSGRRSGAADGGQPIWSASPDEARDRLVDAVTDCDEHLLTRFVEDGGVEDRALRAALRRATLSSRACPVLFGSALEGFGVDLLLDAIGRYLPDPSDRPPPRALVGAASADELAALVFKVLETELGIADASAADRLGQVRVFSGSLRVGDLIESVRGEAFEVRGLCRMHATRREAIEVAGAGEIVGLDLPPGVGTGATLRHPGSALMLEPVSFSHPVLTYALEPETADEIPRVAEAARRLIVHDPTLRLDEDAVSGELRISGMGELQVAIFHERLQKMLGATVRLGSQRVALAETVSGTGEGEAECQRTLRNPAGGPGEVVLSANVSVSVAPSRTRGEARVSPAEGLADGVGGLRQVLATIRKQARAGFIEACPVREADIVVWRLGTRVDGLEVEPGQLDDAGLAQGLDLLLQEAARLAARRAFEAAGHRVMVPIVRFKVVCPHDAVRSVLADLRSRGARIGQVGGGTPNAEVTGEVGLGRILGYATDLRSLTRGRATIAMAVDRFAVDDEGDGSVEPSP